MTNLERLLETISLTERLLTTRGRFRVYQLKMRGYSLRFKLHNVIYQEAWPFEIYGQLGRVGRSNCLDGASISDERVL